MSPSATKYLMQAKRAIYSTLLRVLNPLVKMAIREGVSSQEFLELVKQSYVDVAESDFKIEGKKQSTSRVSVLTGMNRTEVARLQSAGQESFDEMAQQSNRLARVLSGWNNDPQFSHSDELPIKDATNSFFELCRKYSGGVPASAIAHELERVGVLEKNGNSLRKLKDYYIPHRSDEENLEIMANAANDLLQTADYNLQGHDDTRLQLSTVYRYIPEDKVAEFKAYSRELSLAYLKNIDHWLSQHSTDKPVSGEVSYRLGMGLYYIQEQES